MTSSPSTSAITSWERTTWRGESAWSCTRGAVRAIVSELRCRLLYLGAADEELNLLNAPFPRVLPDAQNRWPNQGGHRFWLGPQKRWVWPPPAEWEYASASRASATGAALVLAHPQADAAYPALEREYAWEGNRLRCTVRWRDNGQAFFGMHVIPVDLPFSGGAKLVKTTAVPLGLVEVRMDDARTNGFLPHPALELGAAEARLTGGHKVLKAGFAPQPLGIERRGGWRLAVHPGPIRGVAAGEPDHGYLSQIWVGAPEHDLAELEQLTPFLRGDSHGWCSSAIYVEAMPPTA